MALSQADVLATSTAAFALAISLCSGGYTIYRAATGPEVAVFPTEDVILFAAPEGSPFPGVLGAVSLIEIANTAPDYPDIIFGQAIQVLDEQRPVACLSARGQVRFAPPAQADPAQPGHELREDVAEIIPLNSLVLEVLDVSPRTELPAATLTSRRQLFDQLASISVVDPCHVPGVDRQPERFTAAALVEAFQGRTLTLRYEAELSETGRYFATCSFELSEGRAQRLLERGWINAPCAAVSSGREPIEGGWQAQADRMLDRLF